MKEDNQYPRGWDAERMKRVVAHYEEQSEVEAVAEDESAFADQRETVMDIPVELIPVVRELLAEYHSDNKLPA